MVKREEIILRNRIVASGDVLHGKPRVANTRIQVSQVLDLLAVGKTIAEITSEEYFPELEIADVYACVAYASEIVAGEEFVGVS
jgi:uncharacterized protein (DUF433 family)